MRIFSIISYDKNLVLNKGISRILKLYFFFGLVYGRKKNGADMETANVAAIILTHCDREKTIACLKAVHRQTQMPYRIVLCDNGSGNEYADEILNAWIKIAREQGLDEPVEVYANDRSGARLVFLRLEENCGVGAGFNHALRFLLYDNECRAFWLMHHDTEPEPYALSAFLRHLDDESEKKIGLVGATLIYKNSGLQECAGGGIWRKWAGKAKNIDGGYDKFSHTERKEAAEKLDYVCGASCLVTKELIQAVGLYDERLYMFYEDVEYGLRAKKAGFALNWAPGARVFHYAPNAEQLTPLLNLTEEPELTPDIDYLYIRNRFFLMRKENPFAALTAVFFIPLLLTSRSFKGQKGRFKLTVNAVFDGLNKNLNKIQG